MLIHQLVLDAVSILKMYFSKWPQKAFEMDSFHLKPWRNTQALKNEGEPWFECHPVHHNKLTGTLKDMLHSAGIDDADKSNHSLRATGISRIQSLLWNSHTYW